MNELMIWKLSDHTKEVLKKIQNKKEEIKEDLLSGRLMFSPDSDKLSREYCNNLGILEGLGFLEELLALEKSDETT